MQSDFKHTHDAGTFTWMHIYTHARTRTQQLYKITNDPAVRLFRVKHLRWTLGVFLPIHWERQGLNLLMESMILIQHRG